MSRVRVSVRASNFFIREKHQKSRGNRAGSGMYISMTLQPAINASGAGDRDWAPMNSANLYGGGDGGVCVFVLAHACARVRGHACVMCLQYTIIIFDLD